MVVVTDRSVSVVAVVSGVLVSCAVAAAPAVAGPVATVGSGHAGANGRSLYVAGWVFPVSGRSASVTTEVVVPNVTCPSNSEPAVGPGAYVGTKAVHGNLNDGIGSQVQLDCLNHKYYPLLAVFFGPKLGIAPEKVHVGDLVRLTVTIGPSASTATAQDLTSGHKLTYRRSSTGGVPETAAVGDHLQYTLGQSPSPDPIVDFRTLRFTAGEVDGKPLGARSGGKAYNMVGSGHRVQVTTGPLTGGASAAKHNSFTTTWKHS